VGFLKPYTLYGSKGSGAAVVEAALVLADAPYRLVAAASWQPGPGFEELRRVNPLGQIPTLVTPEGTVLTESAAILIHLADEFPASGLLPRSPSARAQCIRGLVYIAANCYAAIGVIDYPERWCTDVDDALRERIRAGTKRRMYELWDIFADTHPAMPYLSGENLGALDLLAAVVSKWSGTRTHLAASRPALHRLLTEIESEEKLAPIFSRYWPH
jgi:GST-like protein